MRLGPLKTAIRKIKGAPLICIEINGATMELLVQKISVLDELTVAFGDNRNLETGLTVTEDGEIMRGDGGPCDWTVPVESGKGGAPESATLDDEDDGAEDDLDDLLG